MIQRGFRIMGWICVVLGACVPFLSIGRLYRGLTTSWWEPLILLGVAGSTILVGLALALPNPGPRFKVVALSTWGVLLIAFGVVALLLPAEVLVSHGRGPRSIFTAQVRGGLMLVMGGVLISTAVVVAGRTRQERRAAKEKTLSP